MEKIKIGKSNIESSRLVYGCMRIAGNPEKGERAIKTALDSGYNHFDHADIYGAGKSEEIFSRTLRKMPLLRDKIIITSKCGIRKAGDSTENAPGRYDFSKLYIIKSVEDSLKRLGTDYLDILLLHRPDYLFHPEEVSEAFQKLEKSGKVRNFGVSNFRPSQLSMLQKFCPYPLIINQLEINIHRINALKDGSLDQCIEMNVSPQAWCPLGAVAYPAWGNTFNSKTEKRIADEIKNQTEKYSCTNTNLILAWILKHPSNILPIIGSTTPERIKNSRNALNLNYSREDWYRLLEARNGRPVP